MSRPPPDAKRRTSSVRILASSVGTFRYRSDSKRRRKAGLSASSAPRIMQNMPSETQTTRFLFPSNWYTAIACSACSIPAFRISQSVMVLPHPCADSRLSPGISSFRCPFPGPGHLLFHIAPQQAACHKKPCPRGTAGFSPPCTVSNRALTQLFMIVKY